MTYMIPAPGRRCLGRSGRPGMGDIWDDLENFLSTGQAVSVAEADPADTINQTEGGGMSTSVADFTSVGGVCKPRNLPALAAVRAFQGQLNRVAQVKKLSKISTDGSVGPATLALFRQVQAAAGAGAIMGDPSSCMGVAPDVDVLGAQIQAYADTLGAPAVVAGPVLSLSPPTILTKSGKTVVAPDGGVASELAMMSGVEKIALLGVAGGIGYLLLAKRKKRRK